MLSVVYAECKNEAHFVKFNYTECHGTIGAKNKCHYTKCHGTIGAKDQRTSAIILNVMAPWKKGERNMSIIILNVITH